MVHHRGFLVLLFFVKLARYSFQIFVVLGFFSFVGLGVLYFFLRGIQHFLAGYT